MGLLLRIFKGFSGAASAGKTAAPQATASMRSESGDGDYHARAQHLADKVHALCQADELEQARQEIMARRPVAMTAVDAQWLMRHAVLPLTEAYARAGDARGALRIEQDLHPPLVKRFEEQSHFEASLGMLDEPMYRLGLANAPQIAPLKGAADRLLFFVHNLATDYAHTLLLCELIGAYLEANPTQAVKIGVTGVAGKRVSPALEALIQRWDLEVQVLASEDTLYGPTLEAARLIAAGAYDRLIVVSVPIAISFFTGLLPSSRVGWLTMKYQLSCFEHLKHRCSFRSGLRREQVIDGRLWLQAPPLFGGEVSLKPVGNLSPAIQQARRFKKFLYTINREDKIRSPQFLQRIARILKELDDAVFVWTGRQQLPEIDAYFAAQGLRDRHIFAGWVVPDDLMQVGDLFLDTPVLSGNVAALATAVGVPVMTDAEAITWVGTFWPAYESERGTSEVAHLDALIDPLRADGITLQCLGDEDFVRQAVLLARDPNLRRRFAVALRTFAARYFFNAARAADDHFYNLRAPIA
jgi:hypothetical protein